MKKSELIFAFILLPIDIAMISLAFMAAYYFRIDLQIAPVFSDIGMREYLRYALYIVPIWIVLNGLNGLYNIRASSGIFNELYRIFNAASTAMLFLAVGFFFSKTIFFSRLILVFTWIFSIILISTGRLLIKMLERYLYRFGIGRRNLALIGDNSTSTLIAQKLSENSTFGYKVIGIFNGKNHDESKSGLEYLGSTEEIASKLKKLSIDEVALTDTNLSNRTIFAIMQSCYDSKITFKYIPDTFSLMAFNVTSSLLGSMPVMELKSIPLDGWGRILKRVIDFLLALLILIILSPVFIIIALLEIITSRGPVIYSHPRIGRDEKIFNCHKFRSMYINKCDFSKKGVKWTTEADETTRVTPLGRILRKTNIDELPQLLNILVGQMSFIGPRPEQPKFVQKFAKKIPDYFKRHKVKAGLTGWAQVNGLKGDTSIKERVRYDIYYIENWSLWFDLKIIFKTILLLIIETVGGKYEYRSRS